MKTAISLPDDLFAAMDALAKKLGIPRSRLVAEALAEYVARHRSGRITERLDALYGAERAEVPKPIRKAQRRAVGQDDW